MIVFGFIPKCQEYLINKRTICSAFATLNVNLVFIFLLNCVRASQANH